MKFSGNLPPIAVGIGAVVFVFFIVVGILGLFKVEIGDGSPNTYNTYLTSLVIPAIIAAVIVGWVIYKMG